jgi:hypothetical protein
MGKADSKSLRWLLIRGSLYLTLISSASFSFASVLTKDTSRPLEGMRVYNVGVLMASSLDSPFDLERAGPAVDMALELVNKQFLSQHNIRLQKQQARYGSSAVYLPRSGHICLPLLVITFYLRFVPVKAIP